MMSYNYNIFLTKLNHSIIVIVNLKLFSMHKINEFLTPETSSSPSPIHSKERMKEGIKRGKGERETERGGGGEEDFKFFGAAVSNYLT